MKFIARKKTTVTVNVAVGSTVVASIGGVLGARFVLIHLRNGASANVTTVTARPSIDGITATTTGLGLAASGGGIRADGAGGAFCVIYQDLTQLGRVHIPFPYIIISASTAVAGGNITFDIWPLFEAEDSNQLGSDEIS